MALGKAKYVFQLSLILALNASDTIRYAFNEGGLVNVTFYCRSQLRVLSCHLYIDNTKLSELIFHQKCSFKAHLLSFPYYSFQIRLHITLL